MLYESKSTKDRKRSVLREKVDKEEGVNFKPKTNKRQKNESKYIVTSVRVSRSNDGSAPPVEISAKE
jgi:hypothetical protein